MARLTQTRHQYIPQDILSHTEFFESAKYYVFRKILFKPLAEIKAYTLNDLQDMVLNAMLNKIMMDADKKEAKHAGI